MRALLFAACSAWLLASCQMMPSGSATVYALAEQDHLKGQTLADGFKVAFQNQGFRLGIDERERIKAEFGAPKEGQELVLTGMANAESPPEYARMLGQRRAEAVRQSLIELGWQPHLLHSTSRGNDGSAAQRVDAVFVKRSPVPAQE
jgi:outer membrane protein OmpA-like peptidoglycan-associated protein